MGWGETKPAGAPEIRDENGVLIGYAGSAPAYTPDKIDDSLVDPVNGAAVDPKEAAHRLLMGAGMQPGSYNNGAGVGYDAIDKLYASDPRFAEYHPDKQAIYRDVQGLMSKQAGIDAAASAGGGFGDILQLAMVAAAIYAGGAAVGAWGAESAVATAGYEGLGSAGLSGGQFGYTATNAFGGPSLLDTVASKFTPEKIATQIGKTAISTAVQDAMAPEPEGLLRRSSAYGYDAAKAAGPPAVGSNAVPAGFATVLSTYQPIFQRGAA